MDGLRQQAERRFHNEDRFYSTTASFALVEVVKNLSTTTIKKRKVLARNLLGDFRTEECSEENVTAKLQVVRVDHSLKSGLHIDKRLFLELFTACHLDPCILDMVTHDTYTYGVHRFQTRHTGTGATGQHHESFYLSTTLGAVLWSFSSSTASARGVFIPREYNSGYNRDEIFRDFVEILKLQKDLINHYWLLQFVHAIQLTARIDVVLQRELDIVREIERSTGHGYFGHAYPDLGAPSLDLQQVRQLSQRAGRSVGCLTNMVRNTMIAQELFDWAGLSVPLQGRSSADVTVDLYQAEQAREAAVLVRHRLVGQKLDAEVVLQRARNQLNIVSPECHARTAKLFGQRSSDKARQIFNLVNQMDTGASLQIAAKGREDSSSMKVLAVMTTLFLPGTFFATLFALPTLHWDEDQVISSRFWIYWAFSLPCTMLVVVAYKWLGLSSLSSVVERKGVRHINPPAGQSFLVE
jgi:hypothetical protein